MKKACLTTGGHYTNTTTPPIYTNNLGFMTNSVGGSAGFIAGIEISVKEYNTFYNPKMLYSSKQLRTTEIDITNTIGADVGINFGEGEFNEVSPWENPFQRIIDPDVNDGDIGFAYGYFRAGYNFGDIARKKSYKYSTIGVGIGFSSKMADMLDPVLSNNPFSVSAGICDPKVLYMDTPTFEDSVRTALNNRGDSIAEKFIEKHPAIIPKCKTCK